MEFKERKISPFFDKETTPEEQMAILLKRKRDQDEKLLCRMDAERKKHAETLTELALDIHRKRNFEYAQSFRTLSVILEKAGVEVITYIGEELTDEMKEEMNIVQWLPPKGDSIDRVEDAFEPEVRIGGVVTHRAKLICREGGEAVHTPESEILTPEPEKTEPINENVTNTPKEKLHPDYHGCVSKKRLKKHKKRK